MSKGPRKGLKRSGVAIVQYCAKLEWKPQAVFLAGVGIQNKECDIMHEQWPGVPLIGWEAHPTVYECMVEEFPGTLHNYGLGKEKGKRVLYNRKLHKNGASLCPREDRTDTEQHVVDIDTL